jgi:hypothetical protein
MVEVIRIEYFQDLDKAPIDTPLYRRGATLSRSQNEGINSFMEVQNAFL